MTFTELTEAWAERDRRYSVRKVMHAFQPITPDEHWAIRFHRRQEAEDLTGPARTAALELVSQWQPPFAPVP